MKKEHLPKLVVFIFIRTKELRGINGNCDGTFWVRPLQKPTLFFLLREPLIFLTNFLWCLGPLNNLPTFCFQAFSSQVVINCSFVGIAQDFICFLSLVEQHFCFLLSKWICVLVGMVYPTEPTIGVCYFFLRCLKYQRKI